MVRIAWNVSYLKTNNYAGDKGHPSLMPPVKESVAALAYMYSGCRANILYTPHGLGCQNKGLYEAHMWCAGQNLSNIEQADIAPFRSPMQFDDEVYGLL